MTSKQLVNELHKKLSNPVFKFTNEQIKLITKLKQSFETDEERNLSSKKIRQLSTVA